MPYVTLPNGQRAYQTPSTWGAVPQGLTKRELTRLLTSSGAFKSAYRHWLEAGNLNSRMTGWSGGRVNAVLNSRMTPNATRNVRSG